MYKRSISSESYIINIPNIGRFRNWSILKEK